MYIKKIPRDCLHNELKIEVCKQLQQILDNIEIPNHGIISLNKQTAFVKTIGSNYKSSKISENIYSIGTHNDKSLYPLYL